MVVSTSEPTMAMDGRLCIKVTARTQYIIRNNFSVKNINNMTAKQQKEFKKEIKNYLDLEYGNLNQLNKVNGISTSLELDADCMMFAYALGLVSRQYESIWEKVTKSPIDNISDDNLALELQGQVCLNWAEEMMHRPNKTIRDAAKEAQEEYSRFNKS